METAKMIKLGNGLSVPSVQELAKHTLAEIPSRYICTDQDSVIIGASVTHETVPVIDLQNLLSPEHITRNANLLALYYTFQLVNHGVNTLLVENVKSEIERFFNLPMDDKIRYDQKEGDGEGFGQYFVNSDDQRLDWADVFYMVTLPIPLRETMESYSSEMNKLAMILFNMMEKALQVVETNKVITGLFEDGLQSMRMNYYPPCPRPELVIGLTPHSDFGGLTILLQVNEVEGLQIRKTERWISILTNGIYRSVEHRAIINSAKKRLSIATFHDPKLESEIGPISSLITPQTPALFTRIGFQELEKKMRSSKLDGKSFLDCMRTGESN
ncbi:codeine O-demethylase-like [Papaver somniferum]|uniref:codeine O-demethylase-like n=1 Tax=Papaver somniferum TaxID=3469 RepID=UPI000E6FFAFB|nr:codeine O-demethylase-like [Papaver somniferum]